MKRVVKSDINSATNTCGIPAAPAVSEVVEPSVVHLPKIMKTEKENKSNTHHRTKPGI